MKMGMKKQKGFSLVEVIISVFMASFIISGLVLSYQASWEMVHQASEMATARTTAISKLEELRAYTSSQIRAYNNTTFDTTLSNGQIMTGRISVSDSDPPAVTITMSWGSGSSTKTTSVGGILYRPLYEVE